MGDMPICPVELTRRMLFLFVNLFGESACVLESALHADSACSSPRVNEPGLVFERSSPASDPALFWVAAVSDREEDAAAEAAASPEGELGPSLTSTFSPSPGAALPAG